MAKFMKKELIIFFTVLFVAFFPIVLIPKAELAADSEKTETTMIGDLNNNGMIETGDVLMLLRHLSNESTKKHSDWELKGNSLKKADIVENNIINQPDVLALLRYIAAKSSSKVASKHPDWLSLIDKRNSVIVPTDITLDKATLKLMVGQKDKLTATVVPENAEDKRVYWKSSNEKVAEVDAFGNIKAVAEGECTVNATTWNGKTKACIVKITKYVAENGNTANNTNSTSTGSQPSVTGGGSGGGGGGYGDPGSSNPGTGNPGGPGQGNSEEGEEVELTGFEPTANPDTIFTYQSGKINIDYSPENTTEKEMTYTVDTHGMDFTLNEDGSYKAGKDTGAVNIYAKSTDHPNMMKSTIVTVKKCNVDVIDMPQKIVLVYKDENSGSSGRGLNETNITAKLITNQLGAKPEYITDKTLIWQKQVNTGTKIDMDTNSTDDVTVTKTIKAIEPGVTAVFATSNDGPIGMTHVFIRGIKANDIKTSINVSKDRNFNLGEHLIGFDDDNKTDISYESGNSNIATVTSDGIVKAVQNGTTSITAKCGTYPITFTVYSSVPYN